MEGECRSWMGSLKSFRAYSFEAAAGRGGVGDLRLRQVPSYSSSNSRKAAEETELHLERISDDDFDSAASGECLLDARDRPALR